MLVSNRDTRAKEPFTPEIKWRYEKRFTCNMMTRVAFAGDVRGAVTTPREVEDPQERTEAAATKPACALTRSRRDTFSSGRGDNLAVFPGSRQHKCSSAQVKFTFGATKTSCSSILAVLSVIVAFRSL